MKKGEILHQTLFVRLFYLQIQFLIQIDFLSILPVSLIHLLTYTILPNFKMTIHTLILHTHETHKRLIKEIIKQKRA